MREIKFRVWDKKENEMFYSNMYQDKTSMIYGLGNFLKECSDIEEPIMQYTGLKDKNGVEIYENDVVITPYRETNGYIYYSAPTFGLKDKTGVCVVFTWEDFNEFEVIGNIYEHRHLLDNN